jgi:hypothetical protein
MAARIAGVRLAASCAVAILAAVPMVSAPPASAAEALAVLQGLDKVTARISTVRAPIGVAVRFGSLRIVARICRKTPPEEPPESAAFLEIDDVKSGEAPQRIFSGWMFASSPALSALEHPVYDVWVIDCTKASSSEPSSSE